MLQIGVLTGRMDPIGKGHLCAAMAALEAGADRVLLIPLRGDGDPKAPAASWMHRMTMCRLAAACDARLSAFPDAERDAPQDAQDALRVARARYPEAEIREIPCAEDGAIVFSLRNLEDAPDLLPAGIARYIALNSLYQPDYIPALKAYGMGEPRLRHTLGVRQTAVELAGRFGASMQAAGVAAMLHDIAKPLPLERMRQLARQYGLSLPEEMLASGNLLHGPLAAVLAERELGVTDAAVLSAIACHTTGKPGMSTLDKVLFIADAIEPGRAEYPGLSDLRRLTETDLDAAVLTCMERTREYVLSRGLPFCSRTQSAIEDLKKQKEEKT